MTTEERLERIEGKLDALIAVVAVLGEKAHTPATCPNSDLIDTLRQDSASRSGAVRGAVWVLAGIWGIVGGSIGAILTYLWGNK